MTDILVLPEPITLAEAISHAEAIVAEFGEDHVYHLVVDDAFGDCYYVSDDGRPDCIVAHILHRHGVPIEALKMWENHNAHEMGPKGLTSNRAPAPTRPLVTAEAVPFLSELQGSQDQGSTWGLALRRGLDVAARNTEKGRN